MQVSCPGGESRALRTTLQPWVGAMCLALAGCGAAAPGEPSEGSAVVPWFEEIASARGLVFRHESGHRDRHWLPEIIAGGAALFDMDGDGDLDAYFVQSGGLVDPPDSRAGNQLLVNLGEGTFRDVSGTSGADDRGYGMGVAAGDYDQDGDVDLYVTNVGPNVLLRNDGAGRFTDVSVPAGVGDPGWGASAAFVDHDADGDLDLFVTNYLNWSVETELTCPGQQGGSDYCSPLTQHPLDLMVLAYQTDMTRVISFMVGREESGATYPQIGVTEPHHPLSHHRDNPEKIEKLARINAYHMLLFRDFLVKLQSTPDGEGSLLDHVMLLYGGALRNSNKHTTENLPILVAGGGCGEIQGGRHVICPEGTPLTDLQYTMLLKLGVPVESFGGTTGAIHELSQLS